MKIITIALLIFLVGIQNIFGQISISGQIDNAPDSTEVLIYYFNDLVRTEVIVIGNSLLDESGIFDYHAELEQKTFGYIKIGDHFENIFLCPGDTITLFSEYNNFDEKLDLKSKFQAEQSYILKEKELNFSDKIKPPKAFKNAVLYKLQVEEIEYENITLYNKCVNSFKDSYFKDYKREELKHKYIYFKSVYIINNKDESSIPKDYFIFLDSIDFNTTLLLNNSYYLSSINLYLYIKYGRFIPNSKNFDNLSKEGKREVILSSFNIRKTKLKNELRDLMLSDYVKANLQDVKTDSVFVKSILADYYSTCTNKEYVKYIRDLNTKISKQNGSLIPNYTFQNIYGEKVSLHSLKGKYIYIDFWASWCYPCKVYLKDYPILKSKYANRNDIVYLFINVMDDKNKWSDYVLNNPNYGTNWYADENTTKQIRSNFDLDAIPRYMIIDKNLKIIDVDTDIPKRVVFPK